TDAGVASDLPTDADADAGTTDTPAKIPTDASDAPPEASAGAIESAATTPIESHDPNGVTPASIDPSGLPAHQPNSARTSPRTHPDSTHTHPDSADTYSDGANTHPDNPDIHSDSASAASAASATE